MCNGGAERAQPLDAGPHPADNRPMDVRRDVIDRLEAAGIGYFVTGSEALAVLGVAYRATNDIDIVADLTPALYESLLRPLFEPDYLVNDLIHVPGKWLGSVIHVEAVGKADLIMRDPDGWGLRPSSDGRASAIQGSAVSGSPRSRTSCWPSSSSRKAPSTASRAATASGSRRRSRASILHTSGCTPPPSGSGSRSTRSSPVPAESPGERSCSSASSTKTRTRGRRGAPTNAGSRRSGCGRQSTAPASRTTATGRGSSPAACGPTCLRRGWRPWSRRPEGGVGWKGAMCGDPRTARTWSDRGSPP